MTTPSTPANGPEAAGGSCSRHGTGQDVGTAWYYRPVWITVLALLVLGPFALILVWRSRQMGRAWKWALTVLITVFSVYCIYLVYTLTAMTVKQIIEFNRLLR